MKNFLTRLNIDYFPENQGAVQEALEAMNVTADNTSALDFQTLNEAEVILSDPIVSEYYRRMYRQYEAMAVAAPLLSRDNACNTHRWAERLLEFKPDLESSL